MRFLSKMVGSTILGMGGDWVGGQLGGFGTELILGLVLSIVGWYGAGYLYNKYLE